MKGLETVLGKLKESGLHSLQQRGLGKGDLCDCSLEVRALPQGGRE